MNIKSYYFIGDKIVVRFTNNKVRKYDIDTANISNLIRCLDNQINFNINEVRTNLNEYYDDLLRKAKFGLIVEGLIIFSLLISFISAFMISFVLSSVLSIVWFSYMVSKSKDELIEYKHLVHNDRIYDGRQILIDKFNEIKNAKESQKLVQVC